MLYTIVTFGETVLRKPAMPVVAVDDTIRTLAKDMLATMYAAKGLGLAAQQIGKTESICVIDVPVDCEKEECRAFNAPIEMPLVLINPTITAQEGRQRGSEGCLSFPDIGATITRANQVTVAYTGLDGVAHTITAQGLLARAILHETDHLKGVLLVDQMSAMQKIAVAGQLRRLQAHRS